MTAQLYNSRGTPDLSPVYPIQPVVKPVWQPRLYHVYKHSTGCQTGLTTGWMFVHTIQPVTVERTVAVRSTRLSNRLYRANGVLVWQFRANVSTVALVRYLFGRRMRRLANKQRTRPRWQRAVIMNDDRWLSPLAQVVSLETPVCPMYSSLLWLVNATEVAIPSQYCIR